MKKNGFVFMETVVVVVVLSLTLLMLYASYSYILRLSREKKTFDTTDALYATYYVKKYMVSKNSTVANFMNNNGCYATSSGRACDVANSTASNLIQLREIYEVDKLYYLNPSNVLKDTNKTQLLMEYDATTIDYIKSLGVGTNQNVLIVKIKRTTGYADGEYEVFHASLGV